MPTNDDTLGDAPPESVELWIRLVRAMDAALLASFVDRTWRTRSRESIKPIEAAVKARIVRLPSRFRAPRPTRMRSPARLGLEYLGERWENSGANGALWLPMASARTAVLFA